MDKNLFENVENFVKTRKCTPNTWEPHTGLATLDYVRPGYLCVDVGAHVGWYTAMCALLAGPRGGVLAYEPVPDKAETCRRLAQTCQERDDCASIRVYQQGLGDALKYRTVVRGEAWSLVDSKEPDAITILSTRLDPDLIDVPKLAYTGFFLKIDVDGEEARVITGATGFIKKCKPTILLECGPYYARLQGLDFEVPLQFLASLGYHFIADHGKSLTIPEIMGIEDHTTWNVFCVPSV